jgi:hypothetical protein
LAETGLFGLLGVSGDEGGQEGENEDGEDHGGGGVKSKIENQKIENQLSRTRSLESHWDMSERMTRSPGWRPLMISMVLTELRPSWTWVRTASLAVGGELEDADGALLLAEGGTADVDDVVEALELDGAVNGEVGTGTAGELVGDGDVDE